MELKHVFALLTYQPPFLDSKNPLKMVIPSQSWYIL